MLESLAKVLPLQESATTDLNDYATPQLSVAECMNKGGTRLAHAMFDQIDDASDGSLVCHHARGEGVPKMKDC